MKHSRTLCAALLFTAFASSAWADVITVNANSYALGTDLSEMIPGLSMAKLVAGAHSPAAVRPVMAVSTYHDPTSLSFGGMASEIESYDSCQNNLASMSCYGYNVLELTFDAPTNYVEFSGAGFSDAAIAYAYDTHGAVITHPFDYPFGPPSGVRTWSLLLTSGEFNIARVVLAGAAGNVTTTEISYNKVPEPGTMGLLAVGLLAAGLRRVRSSATRKQA